MLPALERTPAEVEEFNCLIDRFHPSILEQGSEAIRLFNNHLRHNPNLDFRVGSDTKGFITVYVRKQDWLTVQRKYRREKLQSEQKEFLRELPIRSQGIAVGTVIVTIFFLALYRVLANILDFFPNYEMAFYAIGGGWLFFQILRLVWQYVSLKRYYRQEHS